MSTPEEPRLPASYLWWLFGVIWTLTGMQILTFGLGWIASGVSGSVAGLVLTAAALPRVLFALAGGSLADRVGPWRVMTVCGGTMICFTAALMITVMQVGTPVWLLIATATVLGVTDAFYRPASGSLPRYLVPLEAMRRASAARQIIVQSIGLIGPALGGALLALLTLAGSAAAALIGFLAMFMILLALRKKIPPKIRTKTHASFLADSKDGLRYAMSTPMLRTILLILAAIAGLVLPLTSLLVPLLARENGWSTLSAGLIAGAFGGGLALSSLIFLSKRKISIKHIPALIGILIAGIAMVILALAPHPALAGGASAVAGASTGIFVARAAPVLLTRVPEAYLSRIQAAALLAQTLPVLIANNLLGYLGDRWSATETTLLCGTIIIATSLSFQLSPTARHIGEPSAENEPEVNNADPASATSPTNVASKVS